MTAGCSYTDTGIYRLGGNFTAVKTPAGGGYGYYCSGFGGWIDAPCSASSPDYFEITSSRGFWDTSDVSGTAPHSVFTGATLVEMNVWRSGAGSVTETGPSVLLGGRYAVLGSSHSFSVSPGMYRRLWKVTVGGSEIQVVSGSFSVAASSDTEVAVYFVPSVYTLRRSGDDRLLISAARVISGAETELEFRDDQTEITAGWNVRIRCSDKPGFRLSYFLVDGVRYSSNPLNISVTERSDDSVYDVSAVFSEGDEFTDSLTVEGSGSVTVSRDGSAIPLDHGEWTAVRGKEYSLSAVPESHSHFSGYYRPDGSLISGENPFAFVQGAGAVDTVARFSENETFSVVAAVHGGDGCSVTVESCPGTSGGEYYAGEWTLAATAAAGWEFRGYHVEDMSLTGRGFDTQDGTMYIDFGARIVAVFGRTDGPEGEEDMGNARENQIGDVRVWEGSGTAKKAVWRSSRFVSSRPVALSCARVFADGYGEGDVRISVSSFESPDVTDSVPVEMEVSSQSPFRLPAERPEKFNEIAVETRVQLTEVAAATSMGALWQNT